MIKRRPYVVYWNNIPAPYMVERFNMLAARDNLDFEAWFCRRTEADRSWRIDERDWRFRFRYLPRLGMSRAGFEVPMPLTSSRKPDLLVSLYAEPSFVIGWAIARLRRIPHAFWAEVTFDSWVPRRAWRNALKRAMFTRVAAVLGGGEDSRVFAQLHGTSADRAIVLPHVIDVEFFDTEATRRRVGRDVLRRQFGVSGTTFLYVGRLWSGKGLDTLIDAFALTSRAVQSSVSLLIVGDGIDEQRLRARCADEGLENVRFAGFLQREQLPDAYAAADVFVLPTLGDPYGLVVDEAMASHLPVLSTTAAGEIRERVRDGHNGFLVRPGDSGTLSDRMTQLACEPELRSAMAGAGYEAIKGRTPTRWAEIFEELVNHILAHPAA